MKDLDDKLDVRSHRGLQPDNGIQKSSASLIPVDIVTDFVFSAGSIITIPVSQQPSLIAVEHALCKNLEGKDRLKTQRAISRSFIETIQDIDACKYCERHAMNREGTNGSRFKYVCVDSLQNQDRRASITKKKEEQENGIEDAPKSTALPTYNCSGAVHIKFSTKRDAINVVYRHNPIHGPPTTRNGDTDGRYMPTQPGSSVPTTTKRRKRNASSSSPEVSRTPASNKKKKSKQPESPSQSRSSEKASRPEPVSPKAAKAKTPCIRCKDRNIKCDEAKPSCTHCRKASATCRYRRTRSRTGCAEKPVCAHCVKIDEECDYA
ncbi:hypothetical protein BCR34DRAFT_627952 [Clohesyomyces aquaticus]|uniref:Zn(2)-C6 fungal-type domain-containing protein n=1 Tax=Clohesyomyces aquaticus TaxID=1231657 RepID=A0A1Y1YRU7_9PLEO|nr:hypothetical protein BCR34DRAFT_627952 [Clohesyomyces aquaticus]